MSPDDVQKIFVAIAGAIGGATLKYLFDNFKSDRSRKLDAQIKFLERQIEFLYGPLVSALLEGQRTYNDLEDSLGRKRGEPIFDEDGKISAKELPIWLFWVEQDFLPRNEFIKNLLRSQAHLLEGDNFPDSHIEFFNHCNSWAILHKRWLLEKTKYSWRSKTDWPERFEKDVLAVFATLKANHSRLIGKRNIVG